MRGGVRGLGPCVTAAFVAAVAACGLAVVERETDDVPSALFDDAAGFAGVVGEPRSTAGTAFWDHWGDGRAELDSYRITTSRYGETREGELVLIYVTEPHDRRSWIKDDDVEPPERVEVLKMNANLEFLTGIYPYSVMTSVFSPVDDWGGERFRPVKIATSVQEWCGMYHHEMWPGRGARRSVLLSYFASDGEHRREEEVPPETLYEDALLIQLRELDGAFADGGDWEGWIVPSLWNVRRGVASAAPVRGEIRRTDDVRDPEGRTVTRFTLRYDDYERVYDVETAAPRRVLGWRTSAGDTVRLADTRRLPYWRLNDPEGRSARARLGLDSLASGRPPRLSDE